MLSRVARQKHALLSFRRPTAQLPRLPHTTLRLQAQPVRPIITDNSHTTPQSTERRRRASFQSHRTLATATDASPVGLGSYDPFTTTSTTSPSDINYESYEQSRPWGPLSEIRDNDPNSSLVILDDFLQTTPKILRKINGIGGDEDEMLANFDVSIKVGRFDRAVSLIQRLGQFFPADSPQYLALHNRYLAAMVTHMIVMRQTHLVLPLQKFFEVDMPNGGVIPDATTLAIMIRMGLRMLHGSKRDRTVRRYWEVAKKQDIEDLVLAAPVLSELELGEISEICSADLQRVAINSIELTSTPAFSQQTPQEAYEPPEVQAAHLKGHGLASLKKSLSLFSSNNEVEELLDIDHTDPEQHELYMQTKQRRLEADALSSALERWREEYADRRKSGMDMTNGGIKVNNLMHEWHTRLVGRLEQELELVAEAEAKTVRSITERERCEYGVYLRALSADKLAALTILDVWNVFSKEGMGNGVKLSTLASIIGRDIRDEMAAVSALEKNAAASPEKLNMLKWVLSSRRTKAAPSWKRILKTMQEGDPNVDWPPRVIVKVGAVLMSLLYETARITVTAIDPASKTPITTSQPAFHHGYIMNWGKRSGVMHLHEDLVKMIAKEPSASLICRHLPMICKPKPWKGLKSGGYYHYDTALLRVTPAEILQPQYVKAAMENHGLEHLRAGLDVLGQTGWVINKEVFDVMLEAWNSGKAVANLAPSEPDLQHPPKPSPEDGREAEIQWNYKVRDIENLKSGFHSNRCFQNFQMEVARAYRNVTFYLPHNMDFRGRAYPLPPYLNQMGADNSRGLLLFSEAKPLGVQGLRWLKIQLANVFGYDKASFSEREQFTMDHLNDVLDSANNGLHGQRWWLKAEDPWQCLAACCELRNALRLDDPTQYLSRLPIHQDGSCNGLQHYAALGGDLTGAQQVNLEPSDRPSDVYTGVAEFVKASIAQDAAQGNALAQLLNGKVTRKVVKQTVMTNVYGVTFIGAMRQVRRQLADHYPELTSETARNGALYIARKIFEALGSMFNGAHAIQYWLGECVNRITQSLAPAQIDEMSREALSASSGRKAKDPTQRFRSTVIWTTPLGLPVVQPYRTRRTRRITTSLQDISIADWSTDDVVNRRRQLQAFPPNFIHSLDATHMLLSANECQRQGLTFSAVHDSFWTHAGDVDSMNRILRDAFIRMHSDAIIGRLAAEFDARYGKHLFLGKVSRNSKLGQAIREYRRANSPRSFKLAELLQEQKRQRLLRSEEPELQAQGRAMVTPASIFESLAGSDADLVSSKTIGESSIGHIPEDVAAAERRPITTLVDPEDPALATMMGPLADASVVDNKRSSSNLDEEAELADEAMDDDEADLGSSTPVKSRAKGSAANTVPLWLPMRFPAVPAKGDWDVSRIRDSEYFFS
ncbi:hypothetical protein ASPZODRAFT_55285 [Penicilliopsis zonata CBS 506.65]|uniref:DNA-directed RNA polymerase n=1 Tax=Penicilliopsis zonata CBS 506.65 TaxID=1073090 RepID=A0A1L9SVM5_9EURO|nr:hypothetical protein ASPZODRAFT_55285 [Penicilliopsis zonata CBS 506.65]OJJ51137.1 hypothetical protein ASPZODRAFT_55285 [Penicilliopsis zonata CBS 506.65]